MGTYRRTIPPASANREDAMLIAAVLLAATPACAPAAEAKPAQTAPCTTAQAAAEPLSEADQAEIKQQARALLFDSAGAQWRWPDRRAKYVYCGWVNEHLVDGSYSGWRPFYFVDRRLRIVRPGDSRNDYDMVCGSAGYVPRAGWLRAQGDGSPAGDLAADIAGITGATNPRAQPGEPRNADGATAPVSRSPATGR